MSKKTELELKDKINYLSEKEQKKIFDACEFAKKAHQHHKTSNGEPYLNHCVKHGIYITD